MIPPSRNCSAHPPRQTLGKVLLVEDESISAELGALMIQQFDLDVDLAWHGQQALEMAATKEYDIIFMDCCMPVKGGIQATRDLRAMEAPWCKTVPIIALTATPRDLIEKACMEAGMDDFMEKPLHVDGLVARLQRFLPSFGGRLDF